ncbi:RNA polymerase recycling motor HelD [Aneurinibacillus sp. REN35]|uniref:RNA polymerase recycling motor HelD n=1 Tax=Aneurinibacillus sp. REN35 TaxID=3237286 RepID=UPI003527AD12
MSMEEQTLQKEQKRVDRVTALIGQRLDELGREVSDIRADVVEIRKNFWDDVTVNFDDPHEAQETHASIKQQAELLSERERSHSHIQNQIKTLTRLRQSPYFGRIDFKEDGEAKADCIYLGIASLLDEKQEDFLVYDWRAPVSSLYYDYPPGAAQYETPSGTIAGIIERKRQYMIRDGQIHSMFDTGVTIGDELLQEVLGKQADTQMKSIVATIQKEQNRIIRDERSRLLVVQGAAGSGKTSAALQRVAYLLYRYRGMLRADHIMLFSPNPMFNSYVSTVLPELGEENMQQTTFQEYLEHRLGKTFRLEDSFAQMEYTLTAMDEPGYEARMAGIRYKASVDFMKLIDRYAEYLGREGMMFKDIKFRGSTIISAERIQKQFYALDPSLSLPNRIQLLADSLLEEVSARARLEKAESWVDEEIELLDKEAYLRAYKKLRQANRYTEESFDDFERERDLLAAMVVKERFKPVRARVKKLRFIDMPAIYSQIFAEATAIHFSASVSEQPELWQEICTQTVGRIERKELAYEDAVPYLYLKERIEGFQTNTSIRHVFIDEAQDYSPFQFAFIKGLFPRSKMTVLGDLNQGIYPHTDKETGFAPLLSLYEGEATQSFILQRSYRSTKQISEFTRRLIAGGETIEPFNRSGEKPAVIRVADKKDRVKRIIGLIGALEARGHKTIGVICKTAQESEEAYEALRHEVQLRLIKKETSSYEPGVLVIPSYLAKGVEFDAVIIYEGSQAQYGRESERKLFYAACTRAMHELHIFFTGKVSPFIAALPPDLYE